MKSKGASLLLCVAAFFCASQSHATQAQVDCSFLDPRVSISKEGEAKVSGSVETLYRIAKAGGDVSAKTKEQIQNLAQNAPTGEQDPTKLRALYLFCGMVANATDISTERKVELYQIMMQVKDEPIRQTAVHISSTTPKSATTSGTSRSQANGGGAGTNSDLRTTVQDLVRSLASEGEVSSKIRTNEGDMTVWFTATNVRTDPSQCYLKFDELWRAENDGKSDRKTYAKEVSFGDVDNVTIQMYSTRHPLIAMDHYFISVVHKNNAAFTPIHVKQESVARRIASDIQHAAVLCRSNAK